jgi:hypothetical protein
MNDLCTDLKLYLLMNNFRIWSADIERPERAGRRKRKISLEE